MKNVVTLQNYYAPWKLEQKIERFVHRYNHDRCHESLDTVTPSDVYHGRHHEIITDLPREISPGRSWYSNDRPDPELRRVSNAQKTIPRRADHVTTA